MTDGARPRVAVIRGEALNPFELQVYAGLRDEFDVLAVGRRGPHYDVTSLPVPVHLLPALSAHRLGRASARLPRAVSDRVGDIDRLQGLGTLVRGCDILHAAETVLPVSEQAAELAAHTGAKIVLTCWENIAFRYDDDERLTRRKARVRRRTDLFIAVTPEAKEALVAEGAPEERVRVVPAGVDVDRFSGAAADPLLRRTWGVPDSSLVIVFVGRMIREKGVVNLVRALAALSPSPNPAHLVAVGHGPEAPRVRTAAAALGVADRVHVVGGQAYDLVPRMFATADIVAVPSLSTPYWEEQFGMVLAEAMSCGRPIVTTRSGSIPNVVGDAAVLVDDYDQPALTAALQRLVDDADARTELGRRARTRAETTYAVDVVAPQLAAAYREVLAR